MTLSTRHILILIVAASASACAVGSPSSNMSPPSVADWAIGNYQPGTHSHNDYDRERPLAEALAQGFASIEVDVALRDGVLYVTHDSADIDRTATLESMYLEPLGALVALRGGSLYRVSQPPLQLLIDVKSSPIEGFEALERVLAGYDEAITSWSEGRMHQRAITVVVSGNRAREEIRAAERRYVTVDGRIWERRVGFPPDVMPIVSINWDDTEGPRDRMETARRLVQEVHGEGRRVRFWNTPDRPSSWAWLKALGVDYIGTDDPERLARFMRNGS